MSELTGGIDSYFWLTLATIFFGGVGLITKYAYKSKCKSVQMCCLKIERDIEVEEREDIEEMKHPQSSVP
jgi:hypothetical protein